MSINIITGDITDIKTINKKINTPIDVIVNAANELLMGGSGVDGAIHRAAGPQLHEACKRLNGCKTGSAKVTNAYNIPVNYIIHTVGPIYNYPNWAKSNNINQAELLASCYETSIHLALELECKSIAFPAISCGIYGYPIQEASEIAYSVCKKYKEDIEITFVLFEPETYSTFLEAFHVN